MKEGRRGGSRLSSMRPTTCACSAVCATCPSCRPRRGRSTGVSSMSNVPAKAVPSDRLCSSGCALRDYNARLAAGRLQRDIVVTSADSHPATPDTIQVGRVFSVPLHRGACVRIVAERHQRRATGHAPRLARPAAVVLSPMTRSSGRPAAVPAQRDGSHPGARRAAASLPAVQASSTSTPASLSTARTALPPWPASHGYARVSNAVMDVVWPSGLAPIGTTVVVH